MRCSYQSWALAFSAFEQNMYYVGDVVKKQNTCTLLRDYRWTIENKGEGFLKIDSATAHSMPLKYLVFCRV